MEIALRNDVAHIGAAISRPENHSRAGLNVRAARIGNEECRVGTGTNPRSRAASGAGVCSEQWQSESSGEVTGSFSNTRHGGDRFSDGARDAALLFREEEERFVLSAPHRRAALAKPRQRDRTAYGETKIVVTQSRRARPRAPVMAVPRSWVF